MTSLKKTEQDVYDYLNKRFRIGWSLKEVTEFYSKLTYRQTIDEAADINKALGTNIYLSTEDHYKNPALPKWTVRGFIKEIYDSREEIQNRLTAPPIAPEPILTKTTKKSSKAFGWVPINNNNDPITFTPQSEDSAGSGDQEFMDNIASSQMEAGE